MRFPRHAFRKSIRTVMLCGIAAAFCGPQSIVASDGAPVRLLDGTDLSMVTDFWRSTFGMLADRAVDSEKESDTTAVADHQVSDSVSAPPMSASEMITSDLPIASTMDTQIADESSEDLVIMSDWETSESEAVVGRGKTFTKNGPSAVTAIVAIVGFIVVGGAYLSGRK